jgi:hypothetical protein
VTSDRLTDAPRTFVLLHVRRPALRYLIQCPWCASFWVTGLVTLGCLLAGLLPAAWWVLWLGWPAASTVAGSTA